MYAKTAARDGQPDEEFEGCKNVTTFVTQDIGKLIRGDKIM